MRKTIALSEILVLTLSLTLAASGQEEADQEPPLDDGTHDYLEEEFEKAVVKFGESREILDPHHVDPGHSGSPFTHFFAETGDEHHFAWMDRDPSTPEVIDIYYDFRSLNGFPNLITPGQQAAAEAALDEWEDATLGKIRFVRNTSAPETDIVNIGTGDLLAVGICCSFPGGILGIGGGFFTHSADHTITRGRAWLDFAENWDETVGNGNPGGTVDYFTVMAQEVGHAVGLGHTDDLSGPDLMDGFYGGEQTTASLNDIEHIREVYGVGGFRVVASSPADGEVVSSAPSSFSFDFSDPYDPASVQATSLTVNGVPADSVDLTDADTLTYNYDSSPVPSQGLQSMTLAGRILADSFDEWSSTGTQGENGWFNGYYNLTTDGNSTYEVGDFIEFFNEFGAGGGPVTPDGNHWTGTQWDLTQAHPPGPWTELGRENTHPNGVNSGDGQGNFEEHWTIRRWVSDHTGAVVGTWHMRKLNPNCGNGVTGRLFLNGVEVDSATIPFSDTVGVTRSVELDIAAGDSIDLILEPNGTDPCDGSANRLTIRTGVLRRLGSGAGSPFLQPFDATFRYDEVQLQVLDTDPPPGIVELPFNSLTIHLNEDVDPASVSPSDIALSRGALTSVDVTGDTLQLGLTGIDTEGPVTIGIAAGAITDFFGNPNLGFDGLYETDFGQFPFPVPLEPKEPLGSLIYDPAANGSIGVTVDGDSFESGGLDSQWSTSSSTPQGRIQVTGSFGTAGGAFALLMDVSVNGVFNLNEAVWTVDLSGQSNALLRFSHADFRDEEHTFFGDFAGSANADGVAISDDGINWHPVFNAPNQSFGVWEQHTIDLSGEAERAGMTLGPDFKIKFQQFDNFALTIDGRGYDEISIVAPGGDTDTFTIEVDPGQTIAVLTRGADTLQASADLFFNEGGSALLGSAVAPFAGAEAVIGSQPTLGALGQPGPGPQTYRVTIGGANDTLGEYEVQILLNADVEGESHAPVVGPDGHVYQVVIAPEISWDAANAGAGSRSLDGVPGHLATITSREEDEFIESLRVEAFLDSGLGKPELWVGGFQEPGQPTPRDGWKWVNDEGDIPGVNGTSVYTNWGTDEPNDFPSPAEDGEEDHLAIGLFNEFVWNDEGASPAMLMGYVVEFDTDFDPSNDTPEQAQDLEPSFLALLRAVDADTSGVQAHRGAVLGTTDPEKFDAVLEDGFEAGTLGPQWSTSSTGGGRIRVVGFPGTNSGNFALWMDSSNFSFSRNEAILTLDLSGLTEVALSFFHSEWGDEGHALPATFVGSVNGDGVSISDDGVNWHTILTTPEMDQSSGVWEQYSFDLAAEAANAGMALGPNFRIKFQQFDNFPIFSDGRGWDDILVGVPLPNPDLYGFHLERGDSVTLALKELSLGSARVSLLDKDGNIVAEGIGPAPTALVNGSFEEGDFTGWTTVTTGGPFRPWQVTGAGFGGGFGMASTSPQDGSFVAWNGFDGAGPMQFILTQDVTVPASAPSATLEWQDRLQWNFLLGGFENVGRSYFVEILDPVTNAVLASLFSFNTGTQTTNPTGDTGWQSHSADLSAFVGMTIRIRFREEIPNFFTGPAQAEIDDVRLLTGPAGPAPPINVDDLIANFVAPKRGTYFAQVTGDSDTDYSLVVTRNADFGLEDRDDIASAQPLESSRVSARQFVIGHIEASGGKMLGGTRFGELLSIDLNTGAGTLLGLLPGPSTEIEFDPTTGRAFSQFPDGAFFGWEFDPNSGAPIGGPIFNGASFTGQEVVSGTWYATAITFPRGPSTFRSFDPFVGSSTIIGLTGVGPVSGLAYDASNGVLYGIAGGPGPADLYTIDTATGAATFVGTTGFRAGSLEFGADGNLYGGGTGPDAGNIYSIDPATGASTLVGPTGFFSITGLALASGFVDSDFYSLEVSEGSTLIVETDTPAVSSGEFVNRLDPAVNLYDAFGTLVASDDNSAADGRDARLEYEVPTSSGGTHFVEVTISSGADAVGGEYVLTVKGASAGDGAGGELLEGDGFIRGDSNADLAVDLSDSMFSLGYLFLGGPTPSCSDAADTNDDGQIDTSDPTYSLSFLFLGGPTIPAPYPAPGSDDTPDLLECSP